MARGDIDPTGANMAQSQPVLWWRLIQDAEAYRARTGKGLAALWGQIHREEYQAARAHMDDLLAAEKTGASPEG